MPEVGRYEKIPRPESIRKFIEYLQGNNKVRSVEYDGGQILIVTRIEQAPVKVFMTNIYIVGEADVHEITGTTAGLGAIVTMSAWNGYSQEAKRLCKSMNIGMFKFNEFLGAVHFDGRRFLDYIPPDERVRTRPK